MTEKTTTATNTTRTRGDDRINTARRRLRSVAARIAPIMGTMTGVATTTNVVGLTFDDGPDPASTPEVLDRLAAYDARATFFMLGERAAAHPGLVNRVADAGHAIGTHGWTHRSPVLDAPAAWREAYRWRRTLIDRGHATLGYGGSRLYRPAYGHQNMAVRLTARTLGLDVIGWSVSANDWADDSPARLAARVLDRVEPGAIVLFHDALANAYAPENFDRGNMLSGLDLVLEALAAEYRFVTVPQLFEYGPAQRRFFYPRPSPESLPSLAGPRSDLDEPTGDVAPFH